MRATADADGRSLKIAHLGCSRLLGFRLLAWGKTLRSRVSVKPKVHVVDSGLAARLLRLTPDKLTRLDPASLTDFGHLLETFVVGEIRKQVPGSTSP